MKKFLTLMIILTGAIALVACNGDSEPAPNVVISKMFNATNAANDSWQTSDNVVELYNNSDYDVKLTYNLVLRIFREGRQDVVNDFAIEGTIAANSFFVIVGANHTNAAVRAKADFIVAENMLFNGDDPIGLLWQGTLFDIVGAVGFTNVFSRFQTLIRMGELNELTPSINFDSNDPHFIGYVPNLWEYIGRWDHQIRTKEQLLEGPRLEERYKTMPFSVPRGNGIVGGGGAIRATLTSIADGDTASFHSSELIALDLNPSVRYRFINTPEVPNPHVPPEPWGLVASHFNRNYIHRGNLGQGQAIYLQSVPGLTLSDTTSSRRTLAIVWVEGHLQPFLMVREGLSGFTVGVTPGDIGLSYRNVLIHSFLTVAQIFARNNNLSIWAGDAAAPDWDSGPVTSGWQASWQPHTPLPW